MKAHRYCQDMNDADDLASETIYKCLSQGRRFDTAKSFKPWALTIMENTYITQYNRRRCVMFTSLEGYDAYSETDRADQRVAIDKILSVVEECSRKSRCIECVMLYADGYSIKEIAERLDIPVGTVKSRISAGRKMLRDEMEI
ncbi:MAG: RNA polymerase sigma factor [Candidatus Amulumruptor caecigallinarius]|nr:RNA polymerase sigma factor [Candidatus Amulumruptor caecigallinarius]MCM1397466.1 RNA polymerase sigma factor [Candidatus Amulumruptor caecigallinarius]MCM1454327.1 RNA polymerase sigma factor [bacterium]